MPVIQNLFRTISCDKPGCPKTITYDATPDATGKSASETATFENPDNAWMKSVRTVHTIDNRNFTYCSDVCEVEAVKDGVHNMIQKKLIEAAATPAQVAQAAAAAKAAELAGKALHEGRPVQGLTT